MSNPFDKFINENREKFDDQNPDPLVWEKLSKKLGVETKTVAPVRSMVFKYLLAAAAILLAAGLTAVIYYSLSQNKNTPGLAAEKKQPAGNDLPTPVKSDSSIRDTNQSNTGIPKTDVAVQNTDKQKAPDKTGQKPASGTDHKPGEIPDDKAMYYYARLIELKHDELKTLEKDEPLLYKQFSGDVKKLDSVYHNLKTQLPDHSNREQVMEAMISNLQLQIALLNRQLKIIKQIKHSKKAAYEKAYKSV